MTPQQALEVLEQATAQLVANRQLHVAVIQALTVLKEHVNKQN